MSQLARNRSPALIALFFVSVVSCLAASERAEKDPALTDQRVDALILRMTMAEKMAQLHSVVGNTWSAFHLGDRDSLDLLGRQTELVNAIVATGTPTIAVLLNGRPLAVGPVAERVSALLEGFYLGEEGATALADILFGDVNPGGKLPITFPRDAGQIPAYYYQKPSAKRGYLYSSAAPLYPFGYGLSYTSFAFDQLTVTPAQIRPGEQVIVLVGVRNIGRGTGDEVVQLYIHQRVASVTRPVRILRGFAHVTLEPGERKTVTFPSEPPNSNFSTARCNASWNRARSTSSSAAVPSPI